MYKAVLFDLDGTIGDTLPLCIAAFRKSIEPLSGRKPSDAEIVATFGPTEENTIRVFLPDRFDEGLAAYLAHYAELHTMCPEPFDGIVELLDFLRDGGVVLGIVTGKGAKSAAITLGRYGIAEYFSDIEFGLPDRSDKVPGIARILERHGVHPREAIYVGDAPSDIRFAREAGVGIVAAAYASTAEPEELEALHPDRVVRTVGELSAYFREIFGH